MRPIFKLAFPFNKESSLLYFYRFSESVIDYGIVQKVQKILVKKGPIFYFSPNGINAMNNKQFIPVNFSRFLVLCFVSLLMKVYNQNQLFIASAFMCLLALFYLIIETLFCCSSKLPKLSFFITGLDILFIYFLSYVTGLNSFFLGGIIYTTAIATQNPIIKQGTFSVFFSLKIHLLLLILIIKGWIPYYNIFSLEPHLIEINLIVAFISTMIINYLVFTIAKSLRDKILNRSKELEVERNKLKQSYDELDSDLKIARLFQSKLIPSSSPFPFIHSIYYPMMHVGGDFFDYIQFRETGKIGIFISDVSGHGVPAAFITNMIKTAIGQSGSKKESPSELLFYLNEVLHDGNGDYFVTALYGIFEIEKRIFTYSNAGHDKPFLISGDTFCKLDGRGSVPLGIFKNKDLLEMRKPFLNDSIQLESNQKLLLFTDGVTEIRRLGEKNYLSEKDFAEIVMENRYAPGKNFLESIFQDLVKRRGGDHFEDDLLLISLDIE